MSGFGGQTAATRGGREVLPDRGVLGPGEEQHVGSLGGAAGAADLLVVRDGRRRRAHVDDEAEVGLVEAHAEGARGDQCLEPVLLQQPLRLLAFRGIRLAGVRTHLVAGLA